MVANCIITYWRDIPAQITVKAGRKAARRELPLRFTEAIDMCAMREGLAGTDDYLAEWRRGEPEPCGDDLESEADTALAQLEEQYGRDRLRQLVSKGGREEQ